jgi:hypothetical protein
MAEAVDDAISDAIDMVINHLRSDPRMPRLTRPQWESMLAEMREDCAAGWINSS